MRTGPSSFDYPVIGSLPVGGTAPAIGRTQPGNGSRSYFRMARVEPAGYTLQMYPFRRALCCQLWNHHPHLHLDDTHTQPDFCGCISNIANIHSPADFYTSTFLGISHFYKSCQSFIRPSHNNLGDYRSGFDRHRWNGLNFLQAPLGLESYLVSKYEIAAIRLRGFG